MKINGRPITGALPPYIIAELSCNHGGSIAKAFELIAAAQWAGADAIKLQTYEPADLTNDPTLTKLYEKAKTPRGWHERLFQFCKDRGITCFSSAFSVDGVRFLEELGTPAHKLASMEVKRQDLLDAMLATGKPVLISMGMAGPADLLKLCEKGNVALLHCVAQYPSRIEDANLSVLNTIRMVNTEFGLSDHTPGYETAIAATALGAKIIEKHFKLDDDCIDAAYSLDPDQFKAMCVAVRAIHAGLGDGIIRPTCEPRKR